NSRKSASPEVVMRHHSCVSGAPSTTTATIWSAGLRAASAIRPPILDQAEILHREEVLMTALPRVEEVSIDAHACIRVMELMMTKLRLTAAERMRLHRKRQRQGLQYVRILLHVTISTGLLKDDERADAD